MTAASMVAQSGAQFRVFRREGGDGTVVASVGM